MIKKISLFFAILIFTSSFSFASESQKECKCSMFRYLNFNGRQYELSSRRGADIQMDGSEVEIDGNVVTIRGHLGTGVKGKKYKKFGKALIMPIYPSQNQQL